VIAPSPARARPHDFRLGSCATPLLRAQKPSPARLGAGVLSAGRPPELIATFRRGGGGPEAPSAPPTAGLESP